MPIINMEKGPQIEITATEAATIPQWIMLSEMLLSESGKIQET